MWQCVLDKQHTHPHHKSFDINNASVFDKVENEAVLLLISSEILIEIVLDYVQFLNCCLLFSSITRRFSEGSNVS